MPNKYYYLVSSLPYLTFDGNSTITKKQFLDECRKWLSARDLAAIAGLEKEVFDMTPKSRGFLRDWKDFNLTLRNLLKKVRSARISGQIEKVPGVVQEILNKQNPLEIERAFERKRWDFLDEREFDFHFDLNWLIVYYLKLQIKQRLAQFDTRKGFEVFDKICEAAL